MYDHDRLKKILDKAILLQKEGNLKEAEAIYKEVLINNDNNYCAHMNLAVIYGHRRDWMKIIQHVKNALNIQPKSLQAFSMLSYAFNELGEMEESIRNTLFALNLFPENENLYILLSKSYSLSKKFHIANSYLEDILKSNPKNHRILNLIAENYYDMYSYQKSIEYYKKIVKIGTNNPAIYNRLGMAYHKNNEFDNALICFNNAIRIHSNYFDAIVNLANIYSLNSNQKKAISLYKKALKIKPDSIETYLNLANLYRAGNNFSLAIQNYKLALNLSANNEYAKLGIMYCSQQICDWSSRSLFYKWLSKIGYSNQRLNPFTLSYFEFPPHRYLQIAKEYINKFTSKQSELSIKKKSRIRIGYFTTNLYEHPVLVLIIRLFELHDLSQFDVFLYSLNSSVNDIYSTRARIAIKNFRDLSVVSDESAKEIILNDNLDIAIDLSGFTKSSRFALFAGRISPIQVSYLGYPATTGSSSIDYIIADKTLIKPDEHRLYSEKILYMEPSYQINDDLLRPSSKIFTRKEEGIPEDSFVFCSFNSHIKISYEVFNVWTDILKNVENSILWLYCNNNTARKNLLDFFEFKLINTSRLVFADKISLRDHMSRLSCADLFLDTFTYSAGATAYLTLRSGLPLLTLAGNTYVSRMSASLLNALSMNYLISNSIYEYKEKAIQLSLNNEILKAKNDLQYNLQHNTLFDSVLMTKNIENIYKSIYNDNL
tara:strand:+ start:39 stop:2180 length:2142 start_codon:yes stop_codon:yes gene_type:complete